MGVHCWGGLGSQLFAWALVEDLKTKFPRRKVRIVLHQSGVTQRTEEIARFFSGEYVIRSDYKPSLKQNRIVDVDWVSYPSQFIKNLVFFLLYRFRILSNCDYDTNLKSVKLWTMQIRGHYSYRAIKPSTVAQMNERAKRCTANLIAEPKIVINEMAVQYRLGDLLTLGTKGPIQPDRVAGIMHLIMSYSKIKKVSLFSDSPDEALRRIGDFPAVLVGSEMNAWDTLTKLQLFPYFVATNSKISIWAIIIRVYRFPDYNNFAPREFQKQFDCNLEFMNQAKSITYY